MPTSFLAQVTAQGQINSDAVDNVLYYRFTGDIIEGATDASLGVLLQNVKRFVSPLLRAGMPADYVLSQWKGVAYENDGTLSTVLSQVLADGGAGELSDARDSQMHSAIMRFGLGTFHSLVTGASALRRSFLSIGPLGSTSVGNNNQFANIAAPTYVNMIPAFVTHVTDILGVEVALPIRCSFTQTHEVKPYVTSWREVTGGSWAAFCGVRKSRQNGR